jgi:DNA-binding PadR family transcriptional regulator
VQLRAATLYTVIKRLLENGFIDEHAARPEPELDDERRRYYRLTARGRRAAEGEARASKRPRSRPARSYGCERHEPWVGTTAYSGR